MDRLTPIYIAPADRLITVFGGGKVALRKINHFDGFRIRVVSKEMLPEVEAAADEKVFCDIDEAAVKKYAPGSFIVIAATSDKAVNMMVRDTSKSIGIMANSAHGGGDVLIPSIIRKRNYSVCVSSEGMVPAFPPYVVEKLEPHLDDSFDLMMDIMLEIRQLVKKTIPVQQDRARILYDILHDDEIWVTLESGDVDTALKMAEEIVARG